LANPLKEKQDFKIYTDLWRNKS